MNEKGIKLGIGFATGRRNFKKVLNSYLYSWNESGIRDKMQERVKLSLFVAYDLDYSQTKSTDFTNLSQETADAFEDIIFLGAKNAQKNLEQLIRDDRISTNEAKLIFGAGYGGKRNAIMYAALENNMDYILFLDDDEYPVAVTKNKKACLWGGQYVLPMHLQDIEHVDITNGYHCGCVSPIPQIEFNDIMTESVFETFIGAISNDIVSWDSMKATMKNGGHIYADTDVLVSDQGMLVEEVNKCKFISGANLCINLTAPERTFPFYNPPGARGEDTFLSTLLSDRSVLRIPCYTFHDGFSTYKHLLDGVLPMHLEPTSLKNKEAVTRFYNACIGWIRYKPLFVYITNPDKFTEIMSQIKAALEETLPKICQYFERDKFQELLPEFNKYSKNVVKHYKQFVDTQAAWEKLLKERKYWHKYEDD